MTGQPMRPVIVRMSSAMHQAIKDKAAATDRTMSQVIRAAVREFLGLPNLGLAEGATEGRDAR